MLTRHNDREDGFVISELAVVMLIVGIMAAIAIPSFLNQRRSTADTNLRDMLASVAEEAERSINNFGDTSAFTLNDFDGHIPPTNLKEGSSISLSGSPTGGFCLVAFHPSSNHTVEAPLLYDSKHPDRYITNASELVGGACTAEDINLVNPTHDVRDISGKIRLIPSA